MHLSKFFWGVTATLLSVVAHAAPVLPSVTAAGWITDRYEAASWTNVGAFQGRTNVLGIGIDSSTNQANRPSAFEAQFYNTQGRQIGVSGGIGDSIAADLFLDANWANSASGFVRTDLWGRSVGAEATANYPIIGFTNFGSGPRLRVFDGQVVGGWVDLTTDVTGLFGTWVAFEIEATTNGYDFFVNGAMVYSDNTLTAGGGFSRGFLQARNFNSTHDGVTGNPAYTNHWSDPVRNAVSAPGTLALAGLALALLASARQRRKLAV